MPATEIVSLRGRREPRPADSGVVTDVLLEENEALLRAAAAERTIALRG